MTYQDSRDSAAGDTETGAPLRCPTCRSQDVRTASKVINTETYWRCDSCGEVWNVGRRREASRHVDRGRWSR